ncbi:hypothetical protein X975_21840, partial [Stegodyphus mimosarum]
MDPACQVGTVRGHGGSFTIWGVFSWQWLRSFVPMLTSLNVIQYIELLGNHLHPLMLFCHSHGNRLFQQDNCMSQRFEMGTAWFDEHSSNFSAGPFLAVPGIKIHRWRKSEAVELSRYYA